MISPGDFSFRCECEFSTSDVVNFHTYLCSTQPSYSAIFIPHYFSVVLDIQLWLPIIIESTQQPQVRNRRRTTSLKDYRKREKESERAVCTTTAGFVILLVLSRNKQMFRVDGPLDSFLTLAHLIWGPHWVSCVSRLLRFPSLAYSYMEFSRVRTLCLLHHCCISLSHHVFSSCFVRLTSACLNYTHWELVLPV
jgi:hypothetical protein